MATDWKKFAEDLNVGVLQELGGKKGNITVAVSEGQATRSKTGKKIPSITSLYTGTAVMGKYNSEFPSTTETIIQAGDVKFVAQFDDKTFVPTEKKDETITFGGIAYKIINVGRVAPDGVTNVVFVIQARRVN